MNALFMSSSLGFRGVSLVPADRQIALTGNSEAGEGLFTVRTGEIGVAATVAPRPGTGCQLREDEDHKGGFRMMICNRPQIPVVTTPDEFNASV